MTIQVITHDGTTLEFPDDTTDDVIARVGRNYAQGKLGAQGAAPNVNDQSPIVALSADGVRHEFPAGTDQAVINQVMKDYATRGYQSPPTDNSFVGDLKGGLHDAGTSIAQGLQAVGGVMARNGMPEYGGDVQSGGKWLADHTPADPSTPGASPFDQLSKAVRRGDLSAIPGAVLHSAVRAIPSTLPILAAGAVTGEAAPLAAGLAAGAEAIGPLAYARAANNGRSQPTTADVVQALPGVAGEVAGGALLPGGSGAAGRLARAAMLTGKDALGGAVMNTAGQLGATVGTDAGASYDPAQAIAGGLVQGGIGAGRAVRAEGVRAVGDGVTQARASRLEAPTPDDARSILRVSQVMDAVKQAASNGPGRAPSDGTVTDMVRANIVGRLTDAIGGLTQAGLISRGDGGDLQRGVNALRVQRNSPTAGLPDVAAVNSRIDALGLPDSVTGPLKDDIRDLNTVYSIGGSGNGSGTLQKAGEWAGRAGAIGLGAATGSLHGAAEAVLGTPLAARAGGYMGSLIDNRIGGGGVPPLALQRIMAAMVLRQMGNDPNAVGPMGSFDPTAIRQAATARDQAQAAASAADDAAFLSNWAGNDAKAAEAIKADQMDRMVAQKASQDAATDKAFQAGQPDTSAVDAYLSGKLTDPSLLPSKTMTTAQEIALNAQRLRNQQAQASTHADQGKRYSDAAASEIDALAQAALNRAARRNAAGLAMAQTVPTAHPDVSPEAASAASTAALKRAQAIMSQANGPGSGMVDRAAVGLPPTDPVPINTSLPANGVPVPTTGAASRLQAAQAAMAPRPAWSRYVANGNPAITHDVVLDALRQAETDRAVPPGSFDLLSQHNGGADQLLLQTLQARLKGPMGTAGPSADIMGSSDTPFIRSPIRYKAAVDSYHQHVQELAADYRTMGRADVANAVLDIALTHHTKASKRAARAALAPDVAVLVPDFVVNQGGGE